MTNVTVVSINPRATPPPQPTRAIATFLHLAKSQPTRRPTSAQEPRMTQATASEGSAPAFSTMKKTSQERVAHPAIVPAMKITAPVAAFPKKARKRPRTMKTPPQMYQYYATNAKKRSSENSGQACLLLYSAVTSQPSERWIV